MNEFLETNDIDSNLIADAIAQRAFTDSVNETFDSPFAKEARRNGLNFEGGKSDDIAVTVGIVELLNGVSNTENHNNKPSAASSTESTHLP